ncbi:TfdA family oxidoreductase [Niveomyces insectorum RCEF 264]|uniref:TfdA family oxidoreductase n=1 Tax=Niveomyces insectorum RCEF 264 TaxID=1081102 RepID=A0A167XYK5_9HYPO|nr:TfdA family oxidoreductase [Niveomyces insectorum RCEF 264]
MALTQRQPDITYQPDYAKYQQRVERLKPLRPQSASRPAGFPAQLTGGLVWEGKDFADERDWTVLFTPDQLQEIDNALDHFKHLDKPISRVSQDTFPLPSVGPLLREQAKELHSGRGFFVLRGLQPDRYSKEENIIVYTGVSSYIGSIRGRQDSRVVDGVKQSSMMNHIKDLSQTHVAKNIGAPAYTTDHQVFHCDTGDIVSLYCLSPAASGGESKLASSWRVYNELAKTRPDLIKVLAEDWVIDGFGNPDRPYSVRPLLFHQPANGNTPERVIIQYARRGFTGYLDAPRSSHIPPITEPQAEALDALHFLAEKYRVTLDFKKGDVQYINNLSIFHARDGFVDEPGKERHLLRLWLRDPELAWDTPPALQPRWDELYKDITEEEQVFNLEPKIHSKSLRR